MIDLNKSLEVFNPATVTKRVHIIGCGAVGSNVAVVLAHLGITKFALYDEDKVESHNIANQIFRDDEVGQYKTEMVAKHIKEINPSADVQINGFWKPEGVMSGVAIMCVDSVVPRQQMAEFLQMSPKLTVLDFRMGLFSGQYYLATYEKAEMYTKTLNFTDEEADANTRKSACHYELSVIYSINAMVAFGIAELVKYWNNPNDEYPLTTIVDMEAGVIRV